MAAAAPDRKNRILSALGVCLAAAAGTLALLAVVYALRGVWPFGTDNVAYVDTAQFYVPGYYKLWDVLHGRASMAQSWYAGLSEGTSAGWKSLISPASLVFLLVSRDHVLEGLSLYLAAKLVIISLGASAALCLRFPAVPGRQKTLLSLLYTFCGFTLQYYTNFSWLGIAAAFPLLLYGLERLLRTGKWGAYAAAYCYVLYLGVYHAYMATLYILFFSLGYMLWLLPREERGDRALKLGLATAAALGLAACFWVTSSQGIATSSRFQSNVDSGLSAGMSTWDLTNIRHTALMLLGMSPAAALLLRERRRAGRNEKRFFAGLCGLFALPMVFTNIDTVWHFGQYNFFPMRYGYMLPATLLGCAGVLLDRSVSGRETASPPPPRARARLLPLLAGAGAAVILAAALPWLTKTYQAYGSVFLTALGRVGLLRWAGIAALAGAAFTVLYSLLLSSGRQGGRWIAAALVLVQIGVNACGFIAPEDNHTYTREYDPAYIETADQLYTYFSGQDLSPLSRCKNVDGSLSAGYAAIAGVSALSSVDSASSATRLGVYRELGYTVNYFRIMDVGGTVFSDMLLGVDRALSQLPVDEDLYVPGNTVAGIQIAASRYPGLTGLMYDQGALDGYFSLETIPERLNCLYRAFTGSEGTVAADLSPAALEVSGQGLRTYAFTCVPERDSFLYLAVNGTAVNITAGGEAVAVPSYLNLGNTVYPAPFNSNLLSLGLVRAGESFQIRFSSALDLTAENVAVTALDKQTLDSFSADAAGDREMTLSWDRTGLDLTVTAEREGQVLFLPITAGGWKCTVNGRPTAFDYPLATLSGVPLTQGKNTIRLWRPARWITPGRGLAITLVTLTLGAAALLLRRRLPPPPRWARQGALVLFFAVAAGALAFVYIVPTVLLIARGTVIWL